MTKTAKMTTLSTPRDVSRRVVTRARETRGAYMTSFGRSRACRRARRGVRTVNVHVISFYRNGDAFTRPYTIFDAGLRRRGRSGIDACDENILDTCTRVHRE